MPPEKGRFDYEQLRQFVHLFAPELEVLPAEDVAGISKALKPDDPPRVIVRRDEGKNYLYLGYSHAVAERNHQRVTVFARADISQVTAAFLAPREEFDALLVVDRRGETIAQRSRSGLDLTRVSTLREPTEPPPSETEKDKDKDKDETSLFAQLRGTTNVATVRIGSTDYKLFVQPMQLSLLGAVGDDNAPTPEEWTICGLVKKDRFRAASSAIAITYWLWIGGFLAAFCLMVPLLKLRMLKPRERLRRFDAVAAAAAVFLMCALATFLVLDVYYFGVRFSSAVDEELQSVARGIAKSTSFEFKAIYEELTELEKPELWNALKYHEGEAEGRAPLDVLRETMKPRDTGAIVIRDHRPVCNPESMCRDSLLAMFVSPEWQPRTPYPFFKQVTWADDRGWQRVKWSTSKKVTPFINLAEAKFPFFDAMKLALRMHEPGSTDRQWGVSVIRSPNTGEELTVFWKALLPVARPAEATTGKPGRTGDADLIGASLAMPPLSL